MTFDEYQARTKEFELMKRSGTVNANDPAHIAKVLGLVGEAGEVAEKYKKIIRDKSGVLSPDDAQEIIKELGDVLWYIAVLADYLGMPLEAVAEANLQKLTSRKARGVQAGSGDNR